MQDEAENSAAAAVATDAELEVARDAELEVGRDADSDAAADATAETEKASAITINGSDSIFASEFMKSIAESLPTMNFGLGLSPTTLNFLPQAQNIGALLPNTDSIASTFGALKGFESTSLTSLSSNLATSALPTGFIESLNLSSLSSAWLDKISMPGLVESLALQSIPGGWIEQLSAYSFLSSWTPPIEPLWGNHLASSGILGEISTGFLGQLDWFAQFTKDLELARTHLPSNWRDVDLEPDDLEDEVRRILEEGIPLAWVPSARVITLLVEASDARARRRVITSNYRGILTSCERVVGHLAAKRALIYVDMIRKAIRALRDGHVEAAQSLATNVLDTLVSQHSKVALEVAPGVMTNASSYKKFRKQSWRLTLAVHPVTTIMSGRFTLADRPDGYRRNATAHAITRHQYNRINAVLAIMNATSLLACFIRDTPAFD